MRQLRIFVFRTLLAFYVLESIFICSVYGGIIEGAKEESEYYKSNENKLDSLALNFKNPPKEYSLLPFWSWNGTLKPEKLIWQIDQMMEKGIHGAFIHARAGLDESETPYFSEGFWRAVDTTISYSQSKGFQTYLYDEDKWPSGSAGGRTVAANPEEFIKKALSYSKVEVAGPQTIRLNQQQDPLSIFAAPISEKGIYDFSSQIDLTSKANMDWNVPEGRWAITSFVIGKDPNAQIDYLDSAAVAKFIEITHDEYFRRYGNHFGNTIPGIFFDEIYANLSESDNSIFWTDDFLRKFRKLKGYDLKGNLPLIVYNDPGKSEKIRFDYFDVVKELYVTAWFKQYADWCTAHKIWATGHTTEKMSHYLRQSDYFSTMGQIQVPGTDNEEYRYGYPRLIDWYNNKQISSIANINKRNRVMAESMGGGGYTIPLEEYRYGFSMLAVYGINMFIPHLFHYSMDTPQSQADWPPSWFYSNPYWKYFKPLADFGSRISFMNSQGKEVCDLAILYPLTDLWESGFTNRVDDSYYKEVQQVLMENHINYNIIDPASLVKAQIKGNKIELGNSSYRIIILPAINSIRQDVLLQLTSFVEKGGIVIGLKNLPVRAAGGSEYEDHANMLVSELFGFNPSNLSQTGYFTWNSEQTNHFTSKPNQQGGCAFFTRYLSQLPKIINSNINPDFVVKSSNAEYLRFNHRCIDSSNVFLLVNDRNENEKYYISIQNLGTPSIWNPETGEIHSFENFRISADRLELILDFKPRESYFLVTGPNKISSQKGLIQSTDLLDYNIVRNNNSIRIEGWAKHGEDHVTIVNVDDQLISKKDRSKSLIPEITLDGDWQFQVVPQALDYIWSPSLEADTLTLPIMKFQVEKVTNDGLKNNWSSNNFDDAGWKTVKIYDVFNKKTGIQRYFSAWDGYWISYYDYSKHLPNLESGERRFKKDIFLDGQVKNARVAITAEKSYELLVNNNSVGSDDDWKEAELYDIFNFLKPGKNSIEVKTDQTKGLLLQGFVRLKNGQEITLRSDSSWTVSANKEMGQPAFHFASPPQGHWGNIINPIHKAEFPVAVWYRQQLPPGVFAIKKPAIKGNYLLYVNGKQVGTENQQDVIDFTSLLNKGSNFIAIRVEATDTTCGLLQPVEMVCGIVTHPLISWTKMGLSWYSGRALYTKKVEIPANYFKRGTKLVLDPGKINYFAEIWVNEKLVTFSPWAPFDVDITNYAKEGENVISIVVANLQANESTWNILDDNISNKNARWWHDGSIMREKEKLVSGLLGPVKIVPFTKEAIEIKFQRK